MMISNIMVIQTFGQSQCCVWVTSVSERKVFVHLSMVWDMFVKKVDATGSSVGDCKLCKKLIKIPQSKATTNLLGHLKNNHAGEVKKWEEENKVKGAQSPSTSQQKIEASFTRIMKPETRRSINKKLAILMADASLSLRIPRLRTFKNFVQSLNGSYVPPTSRTLLKIMDDYVNEIDGHNRKLLAENAARVVITADCWTSFNANTGLLAISGHIVSPDFGKRENFILDCVSLGQESHTADLIADKIRESLGRVNLKDNDVFTVVADGASTMKKASSNLEIDYIQCTAHIINLAVRSALQCPQVAPIIQKYKGIISKLNRSETLKGSLSRCLKAEGLTPMTLAPDCSTRWNSTYMMIGDILTAYSALERMTEEQGFDHFEQHEVKTLKALQKYLEPFYALTKKVCSADATISLLLASGKLLVAATELNNNDARVKLKQFGEEVLTKTKKYFTKWFDNATVRIATLLDPRFAFEEKIMYADQWRNTVDEFVGMQESGASASGERNVDDVEKEEPQKSVALTSFWDPIVADEGQEELGSKRMRLSTEEDELKLEVQRFMLLVKKKRPDKDSDPLKWWSLYKQDFSLMSRKAHQYLSIPATSVDCERMFSIAGIAYGNKRRGRLSGSHARLLLMVKAHENRDAGRECKYWTRWEMKRYSAKERTEESSSDDDDSSSCGSDEAEMSEELGSRGFSDDSQR
ncbi:hypothetical protein Q1695_012385 [Nippostrongylus brasiliensis]|nr:hypothetical protein Q1695_012385 [Nippostrongylus brasiliensis]